MLKSHRSKTSIIYMQSWKQCALPVINTMALWQLMHLGTWGMVCALNEPYIMYPMHELPQSDCGDNREGTLFSWLHIMHIYILYFYTFFFFTFTLILFALLLSFEKFKLGFLEKSAKSSSLLKLPKFSETFSTVNSRARFPLWI